MTREEALNTWLPVVEMALADANIPEAKEALEIAMQSLEQEPCEMTAEEYRQRMIQAFHNADCDELIAICVLPTEKEFEYLEWLLKNHYKKELCEDCISRQAVLDTIGNVPDYNDGMVWEALSHAQRDVALLPPVTPAEKVGHWITLKDEYGDVCEAVCSNCDSNGNHRWVYCPKCGTKMQEVEE